MGSFGFSGSSDSSSNTSRVEPVAPKLLKIPSYPNLDRRLTQKSRIFRDIDQQSKNGWIWQKISTTIRNFFRDPQEEELERNLALAIRKRTEKGATVNDLIEMLEEEEQGPRTAKCQFGAGGEVFTNVRGPL